MPSRPKAQQGHGGKWRRFAPHARTILSVEVPRALCKKGGQKGAVTRPGRRYCTSSKII